THTPTAAVISSFCLLIYENVPHQHPHSFPTRRSSDLLAARRDADAARAHERRLLRRGRGLAQLAGAGDRRLAGADADHVWHRRRSEEHTSELQSLAYLVCRLLLEKKKISYPAPVTLKR